MMMKRRRSRDIMRTKTGKDEDVESEEEENKE
jgi:hypothetical protein